MWYSTADAAEHLGVTPRAITKRAKAGALISRKRADGPGNEVWLGDAEPPADEVGEHPNSFATAPNAHWWLRYHPTSDRYNYAIAGRVPRNIQGQDVRMVAAHLIDFDRCVQLLEQANAPAATPTKQPAVVARSLCHVIALDDVHIGDASDYEDHKARIVASVRDLARRAGPVDTIQIAFGDLCTVDTIHKTTSKGTQLHPTGSAYDVLDHACDLTRRVVDECLLHARNVVWVAKHGNHDLLQSHSVMLHGAAWYRHEPRVDVRLSHSTLNVFEWGRVLIAHHHGHWRRMADLPMQVARDFREAWGRTTDRYVITGHRHHIETVAKELVGATVLQVRSSAPPSDYEANMGFGSLHGTTGFVFDRERGMLAQLFSRVDW